MKPTPTMLHVLANLVAGRPSTYGLPGGRSMSGGLSGTFVGMHRRGLLDKRGNITDAGRAALAVKLKAKP